MLNAFVAPMHAPLLRIVVAAALSLTGLPTVALAADGEPDFATRLPAQVGEWRKPAKPVYYERKTLYDYIDGGAELYLAFDFVRATTFAYTAGQDDEIKVDIFDMGSPRGAFGVFAHGREAMAADVGQGSEYGGGLLTFWKHRWFVSVLGYPETESKRKAVYELGQAIAALIPETGAPPAILTALPKLGLVEASASHLPSSPATERLRLRLPRQSLADRERHGGGAGSLRARRASGTSCCWWTTRPKRRPGKPSVAFQGRVLGGAAAAKQGDRWAGLRRTGKRLVIVLAARSRQAVNQILSEVP